jgi:putative addiction module component (TIGR02574 family)
VGSFSLLDGATRVSLVSVSKDGERLLHDALKLGLPERAELAVELLASLDGAPDEDAEAAWAAEIERRTARARSGDDPGRPWSEVRDRIRSGLAKR